LEFTAVYGLNQTGTQTGKRKTRSGIGILNVFVRSDQGFLSAEKAQKFFRRAKEFLGSEEIKMSQLWVFVIDTFSDILGS